MSRPAPLSLTASQGCHRRARHRIAVAAHRRQRRRGAPPCFSPATASAFLDALTISAAKLGAR
eukprot:10291496-Alexandrium_andersonii.AAC.1